MKTHRFSIGIITALLAASLVTSARADPGAPPNLTSPAAPSTPLGTAFTYQGQLKNGTALVNGACDIAFRLYDSASGGNQVGDPLTQTVGLANGLFTTALDFGPGVLTGEARWLHIQLRCPTGIGVYVALTPRQPLTAAPYALALPGLYTQPNAFSPNVIGGYSGNFISTTVYGSVIGGGGSNVFPNSVRESLATIAGGSGNTASGASAAIGGGSGNESSGAGATVGGGQSNASKGYFTAVGGGTNNTASGDSSSVGGGIYNTASGPYATIGGGSGNVARGAHAAIPGGVFNEGVTSTLAAGRQAKALHLGAFVWADSTYADFASTAPNQFLVRAAGRVGITNNGASLAPTAQLHVESSEYQVLALHSSNTIGTWAGLNNTSAGGVQWSLISTGSGNGEGAGKLLLFSSANATIMTVSGGNQKILMSDGANETSGVWTNSSDRNLKANFAPVDGHAILAQIARLPVSSWNYKADDPAVRHIGPMAQDFYAAFNVGNDNTHIGTVDTAGVALAAIQALDQENKDLKARNTALEARMTALEQRALEQRSQPAAPSEPIWLGAIVLAVLGLTLFVVLGQTRRAGLKHNNP